MKFTRSQFAKTFGVSMESLRYLEKNGILQIARNEDNQYMEYTEAVSYTHLDVYKRQMPDRAAGAGTVSALRLDWGRMGRPGPVPPVS